MDFLWPVMLWSLLLLPPFLLLILRRERQRRQLAARYGSLGLMQGVSKRQLVPQALFLSSMAILLVALARPQSVVSLPKLEGTIILAFDVSGSMAAADIQPSRMEAAKAAASEFVSHQPPSVQIGVVAFSDSGFSVQSPTNDRKAVLASISRLTPQHGTSLANGILVSLNTITKLTDSPPHLYSNLTPIPAPTPTALPPGTHTPAVILLLTDGENNESPDPLASAQKAADRGVRIFTVGLGSPAGTTLHVNGFTVHTQLNEALLRQISQITEGVYYNAENEQDLRSIYDHLDEQLIVKPEKIEVTSLLAGAGIFTMLIGAVFSLTWFKRLP